MSRRDERGQQGKPPSGAGVVDLGSLRDAEQPPPPLSGQPVPFYANDVQPSIETEGNLTLTFSYLGPDGESDSIRVSMATGLLVGLVGAAPDLVAGAAERYLKQGQGLANYLRGIHETAGEIVAKPSATTTPIDQGRRG